MKNIPSTLVILLILWIVLSEIVFSFRHSWMTDTERLIYIKSALLFRKVAYHDARP